MRNPFGTDKSYTGDYNDNSPLWTDELRDQVGSEVKDDGIFFMKIEDFHKYFNETIFNVYNVGWGVAHFLKLNDLAYQLKHKLVVLSTTKQKVWLTAHTWDERQSAKACLSQNLRHYFWVEGRENEKRAF